MSLLAMPRRRLSRPPAWLLVATLVAIAAVVALLAWPEGSPALRTSLRVRELPAAVRALDGRLGGPSRYVGVIATADGVSLLVARGDDQQAAWFYRSGELVGPGADESRDGLPDFSLDGVAVDRAETVARRAEAEFPGATIEAFAVRKVADAGVVWELSLRSARGGQIDVRFSPAGDLLDASLR